jgi:hypothetical protein
MNLAKATRAGVTHDTVRELFTCIHEYITQLVHSHGHDEV